MRIIKLIIFVLVSFALLSQSKLYGADKERLIRNVLVYKLHDSVDSVRINLSLNGDRNPVGYETELMMAVCDDKLCANVSLKINWDLAGNYSRFDTILGKPLTKFDHKRFTDADYKKLDQILKDRNSILRALEKNDLIDKSVHVKSTIVDAVTGATPSTIKNAVVEGAVYSSYTLWHFVFGTLGDSIRANTHRIYCDQIAQQLLQSSNFETQFFALKQWSKDDFETHSDLLFQVIRKSVPLIKAYVINKMPLPFSDQKMNQKFIALFPELDAYSKSIFLDRIAESKPIAEVFFPLKNSNLSDLEMNQREKYLYALKKFEIKDLTFKFLK